MELLAPLNRIPLSTNTTPTTPISLFPAESHINSSEYSLDMAEKYSFALGDRSPGVDVLYAGLSDGSIRRWRELAAQEEMLRRESTRNELIGDLARNRTGATPTELDLAVVKSLTDPELFSADVDTILEERYARVLTEMAAAEMDAENGVLQEALEEDPEGANRVLDQAEFASTRMLIAQNVRDEISQRFSRAGLGSQAWAVIQTLIPFKTALTLNNVLENAPRAILPGDSVMAQRQYLFTLPPHKFQEELRAGVDRILEWGNYLDALTFLNAVVSYSADDAMLENAFMIGFDIAPVVPVVGTAVSRLSRALSAVPRVVSGRVSDVPGRLAELGLNSEAAAARVLRSVERGQIPSRDFREVSEVELFLPTIARPNQFMSGRTAMNSAAVSRLQTSAMRRSEIIRQIISGINRVEIRSAEELGMDFSIAATKIIDDFTSPSHQVIDVRLLQAEDSPVNIAQVEALIGRPNGDFYATELTAASYAKKWIGLRTDDYQIMEAPGGRWAISVKRNISHVDSATRNMEIPTTMKTPDNTWTRILGFARSPDYKVSPEQGVARGVAVHSSEHMGNLIEDIVRGIRALNKKEFKELDIVMRDNRDFIDPQTGRGRFFNNTWELEDFFHAKFNHLPSERQIDAYHAYVAANDLDWIIRNFDVYKQKARLGLEEIELQFRIGNRVLSEPIVTEGRIIDELPPTMQSGKVDFYTTALIQNGEVVKKAGRKKINEALETGKFKIIQLAQPTKIGEKYYNYVVSSDFKRNRLSPFQLPRKPGGHVIYRHPMFIKQAIIHQTDSGASLYVGDRALAAVRSLEEGRVIQKAFQTALEKFNRGDKDAKKFIEENLPMSWTQFRDAVRKKQIDPTARIVATPAGRKTIDVENIAGTSKAFIDATENSHNLTKSISGRFLGERDAANIPVWAAEQDALIVLKGDPLMSPIDTLRVAMSNMIDVHVMNDLKIKAVSDYTKEFRDILEGTETDFIQDALSYLYNPRYRPGADPGRVNRAEGFRKSTLQLISERTFVSRAIDMHKEKLVRGLRTFLKDDVADWISDTGLPALTRVDQFLKGFAFHTKMGLFNPKQLFLQATAMINIWSIAPTVAPKGANPAIYALLRASMFTTNPDVLKGIASKSKALGWDPDEFTEMLEMYRRSGFHAVGGDVQYLDMLKAPGVRKSRLGRGLGMILDAGTTPFREGERIARGMSFMVAYLERKASRRPMNRRAEAEILQRAKNLSGNMTRDSAAAWQKGYLAVVTQFFGYQARMMEQMLGGKLTPAERLRLFTGMSFIYGVPVGMGMTAGVIPIREALRDWLASEGVRYDDTIVEPFLDGFASSLLEFATGADLNVAERYGPQGLPTFYDIMKQDVDLAEMFLGASGGIVTETIRDAMPFLYAVNESINLDANSSYPILFSDLIEPFRNVSSINNGIKLYEALNTGRWVSQNQINLTDISGGEAFASFLFGLDPERVSDAFNQSEAIRGWQDRVVEGRRGMVRDYRIALRALREGNTREFEALLSRIKAEAVRLGMTVDQLGQVFVDAAMDEGFDEEVARQYEQEVIRKLYIRENQ